MKKDSENKHLRFRNGAQASPQADASGGGRRKWYVLLTVMVGTMASIMSSTIINVAVPAISDYFAHGQKRAQWVSAAFMVSMTLAMALTPWLLQRSGPPRAAAGWTGPAYSRSAPRRCAC
jgi:cyanate permease